MTDQTTLEELRDDHNDRGWTIGDKDDEYSVDEDAVLVLRGKLGDVGPTSLRAPALEHVGLRLRSVTLENEEGNVVEAGNADRIRIVIEET